MKMTRNSKRFLLRYLPFVLIFQLTEIIKSVFSGMVQKLGNTF